MLVAYGPDDRLVVAEETQAERLQYWSREHLLHCPNCRGTVHVRGGGEKRTQLHFAHQKGECAWSTEGESLRHMQGKLVLAQWLREQFPQAVVMLEERLPEPNRIADIFVVHADGQRWAVEFQCAQLEIDEWRHRHGAYRQAGIIDIWIIGNNRREKQEAFIDAVLTLAHEVMFLDPLATPPRAWLRWPITRQQALVWQEEHTHVFADTSGLTLEGQGGRMGYGLILHTMLQQLRFDEQANLVHPTRLTLERRERLIREMRAASTPNESQLYAYLHHSIDERALQVVVIPLLRAYLHDPDLLQRYNYGRGLPGESLQEADRVRVQKAQVWLTGLVQQGFTRERLHTLVKALPFIGPYTAFGGYLEMLLALAPS